MQILNELIVYTVEARCRLLYRPSAIAQAPNAPTRNSPAASQDQRSLVTQVLARLSSRALHAAAGVLDSIQAHVKRLPHGSFATTIQAHREFAGRRPPPLPVWANTHTRQTQARSQGPAARPPTLAAHQPRRQRPHPGTPLLNDNSLATPCAPDRRAAPTGRAAPRQRATTNERAPPSAYACANPAKAQKIISCVTAWGSVPQRSGPPHSVLQ